MAVKNSLEFFTAIFYCIGNCIKMDLAVFLSLGKKSIMIGEICRRLLAACLLEMLMAIPL